MTFIIFPMVNNRSAPRQKHGHRGKSSFFHQIIFRKNQKSQNKVISFCRVVGFWGAVPGGVPGQYFWGDFGGPGAERLLSIGTIISVFGVGWQACNHSKGWTEARSVSPCQRGLQRCALESMAWMPKRGAATGTHGYIKERAQ